MAQAKNKDETPAGDTKPDENPELAAALARVKELEDALAKATTPPAPDTTPVLVEPLAAPKNLPQGFVWNAMTGQAHCGVCIQPEHPLDPTATSWTCEHGSWTGTPRILKTS